MALASNQPFVAPAAAKFVDTSEVATRVERVRKTFDSGVTRTYEWRMNQLRQLARLIDDYQERIHDALETDLGKCSAEAWIGETGFVMTELRYVMKHLKSWMRSQPVKAPMIVQPGKAKIVPEPLGVALIIAPWNYPFQLAVAPLVGAISAGCCAVIKPSEVAPATSAIMAEALPKYLDRSAVVVVEGGVPETTALLEQKFDLIFYTGNGTVARVVMAAAAKQLTPVVLELGGKSPCIVDHDVDLKTTARRIVWGKYFNAGQTCLAPDYVLVHESVQRPLLEKIAATVREFYGDDPQKSPDYARIVNVRHHKRLSALLGGGKVYIGGKTDEADRYIAPTVLTDVKPDSAVMTDEIFGPILPVLPVASLDEAIGQVNRRPKPLALYVFSNDAARAETVVESTSSGGACINDVIMHLGVPALPFGGVGPSGMGNYRGRSSFEAFTHRKGVLTKPFYLDAPLRYPPYTADKLKWAKRLA